MINGTGNLHKKWILKSSTNHDSPIRTDGQTDRKLKYKVALELKIVLQDNMLIPLCKVVRFIYLTVKLIWVSFI